jgi:hypothetical protein
MVQRDDWDFGSSASYVGVKGYKLHLEGKILHFSFRRENEEKLSKARGFATDYGDFNFSLSQRRLHSTAF